MILKCPFYPTEINPCTTHNDCLFNRVGGCAIVLAALNAIDNKEKLNEVIDKLLDIEDELERLKRKLPK